MQYQAVLILEALFLITILPDLTWPLLLYILNPLVAAYNLQVKDQILCKSYEALHDCLPIFSSLFPKVSILNILGFN